jgi:hypothetical protein
VVVLDPEGHAREEIADIEARGPELDQRPPIEPLGECRRPSRLLTPGLDEHERSGHRARRMAKRSVDPHANVLASTRGATRVLFGNSSSRVVTENTAEHYSGAFRTHAPSKLPPGSGHPGSRNPADGRLTPHPIGQSMALAGLPGTRIDQGDATSGGNRTIGDNPPVRGQHHQRPPEDEEVVRADVDIGCGGESARLLTGEWRRRDPESSSEAGLV